MPSQITTCKFLVLLFIILLVNFGNKFWRVGKQLYRDPTTYHAVDEAVQDFANEVDRKYLQIGSPLGGGEFAEVFIGTLRKEKKTVNVAIKTLRVRNSAVKYLFKIRINYYTRATS